MSGARFETLAELIALRGELDGARTAFHFLAEGECGGEIQTIHYRELYNHARRIAAALQAASRAGERALLLYPPGLELVAAFLGCLLSGVIAVPAYPPDPRRLERTLPRLRAIARDAQAALVLTSSLFRSLAEGLAPLAPELAGLPWLATDELAAGGEFAPPALRGESVAFLQYTSGSTAEPKGVVITHANLLHNSAEIFRLADHSRESVYVSWLPAYHDMGLIGGILQPIFGGFPGVLMPPMAFLSKPVRWLQAISNYRGTTSPFPNFALELCVRKVTAAQRETLDLRSWRLACNGAEPIRAESLERFTRAFASCGFSAEVHYPAYGLAEATLIVSGGEIAAPARVLQLDAEALKHHRVADIPMGPDSSAAPSAARLVGCGASLREQEIAIVDVESRSRRGDDEVGEIWVRGPSVAAGYWNRPELTRETFGARLADGSGPWLRTGDLGFLRGDELFVTGRCKDLLILRGRNYYPQDLELTAERSHPDVRPGCVVAFSLESEGEERLALLAEVAPREARDRGEIEEAIRGAISGEHALRAAVVALLAPGALPKTSSGKLQRTAARAAFQEGTLSVAASE